MVFKRIIAGGVWLLTLLLAISTIFGYETIAPSHVKAADEAWSLYRWDGDRIIPVTTTMKFTGLSYFDRYTNSLERGETGVAQGTDGRSYTSSDGKHLTIVTNTPVDEFHLCKPGQGLLGHSGCGASAITIDGAELSVDTEGRAWVQGTLGNFSTTPTPVQGNDSIEYATVAGGTGAILLLGRPRAQTPQTVINQMPTTGAPTGLASIGLLSTGIGLIGVMLMLIRRRD